jgi:5-(carboxyamino)imidazole ribonucleotide synthase
MTALISPGSTLGVLGSGQLGRMFAIAARRLGYRVHVLSPDDDTPTGQVADLEIRAAYDDLEAVASFARGVSVVTFEFENVPAATTAACERFAPVRPGGGVLHTTQNRLREKMFLKQAGIPITPFWAVRTKEDLQRGLDESGYPAVLKTADWGYDGKGQAKLQTEDQIDVVWPQFAAGEAILEVFIDFQCAMHNTHRHHILDVSVAPAAVSDQVASGAIDIARQIMSRLEVVGVLCVEFFVTRDERLLVNELAPRPHNSGHLTIDACTTCQFEQQVRAVCGLPLGSPRQHRPAAMANLLGDLWSSRQAGREPDWAAALAGGDVKLHLYGKAEPRPDGPGRHTQRGRCPRAGRAGRTVWRRESARLSGIGGRSRPRRQASKRIRRMDWASLKPEAPAKH